MREIRVGRWTLSCDYEATRRAYAEVPVGAPEACGCATCRNFAALRAEVYPLQARTILRELGIDPAKEAGVSHGYRRDDGLHGYQGWFHFVGRIRSGRPGWKIALGPAKTPDVNVLDVSTPDFEAVTRGFSWGFSPRRHMLAEAFGDEEVVQLDFLAAVRWALDGEEPEPGEGA